ncbi:hypothetical protein BCR39DRAFT_585630 [Naematelia encephala]|uniref:GYF domain-containing protein n=1 Tax=Naematelia encephala TaxID=71784 RepID=A0A1Y2BKP5_9TREE|nr:hypothetical protein BCR39DRAFT_585630 [Naematelia encephala]
MPVKRAHATSGSGSKRTRFTSPSPAAESSNSLEGDDNAYLEDDLPESSSRIKSRERRKVKDTDGYGSDSSNDEEGVVPSRRPGGKEEEEEDVDMFADDVPVVEEKGKSKGKEKEFMDLDEIEGQEFDRPPNERDASDDSDLEERVASNKAKGFDEELGTEITPFNMKNEMEEGRFTADGEAFVANERDPNEKHDMWLDDLDKEEIKKARKAHREREKIERERQEKEANLAGGKEREHELMREAVKLMERGETVLEALQRLGKDAEEKRKKDEAGGKKKSWAERQKERKAAMAVDENSDPLHTSNPFVNLSNIVSALTSVGHLDVYSLSKESLQRMLPAQSQSQPQSRPPTNGSSSSSAPPKPINNSQFQYRFSLAYVRSLPESQRPVEREIFGPFSAQQLSAWKSTGFFGPACENVELRKVPSAGEELGEWGAWTDVVGLS